MSLGPHSLPGKATCDAGALIAIFLAVLEYLPKIAAGLAALVSLAYYAVLLYETKSVKKWLKRVRGGR